jgi:hypothetical protein
MRWRVDLGAHVISGVDTESDRLLGSETRSSEQIFLTASFGRQHSTSSQSTAAERVKTIESRPALPPQEPPPAPHGSFRAPSRHQPVHHCMHGSSESLSFCRHREDMVAACEHWREFFDSQPVRSFSNLSQSAAAALPSGPRYPARFSAYSNGKGIEKFQNELFIDASRFRFH